ncbi:MAG: hypothetical protein SH850_15005 [Planctomycetaceae bacterium]|nr:hypothetical protein [Planctomycetaceae bacterium]
MSHEPMSDRPTAKPSLVRQILWGAFWCNAGMFLVAPIVALMYQFPAWPYGKVGGPTSFTNGWDWLLEDTIGAVWLTLLFGMLSGGVLVLAVLGGAAGAVTCQIFRQRPDRLRWKTIYAALLIDLLVAVVLALAADTLAPHLMFRS